MPRNPYLMTLLDLLPGNPYRPVDWRWKQATIIMRDRLPLRRKRNDAWVRTAVRLQGLLDRTRRCRPSGMVDALREAYQLRSPAHSRLRLELEARLLAGQAYAEIATCCAIDAAVVEAYERVFYNVTELLGAPDAVHYLLDFTPSTGTGVAGPERAVRILAYHGGPYVVDALMHYVDHAWADPVGPGSVVDEPRLHRIIRRAIAVLCLEVNPTTAPAVLRLHEMADAFDRDEAARRAGPVSGPVIVIDTLPEGLLTQSLTASPAGAGLIAREDVEPLFLRLPEDAPRAADDVEAFFRRWAAAG